MSLFDDLNEIIAESEVKSGDTSDAITSDEDFETLRKWYMDAAEKKCISLFNKKDLDLTLADTRFSTSLPLDRVRSKSVAIVGAGGLGNWQWRILVGMGFNNIAIYDDDTVSLENIGPQAHSLLNIGRPKVDCIRDEALLWRGVYIKARNMRVYRYSDICRDLGYSPDIVITVTDSAEFRNGFISDLLYQEREMIRVTHPRPEYKTTLPEVLLDFRMSLGDWNCYAIPFRSTCLLRCQRDEDGDSVFEPYTRTGMFTKYRDEAIFEESEAVHEPCTERAIVYTGANAAAYTGAWLHWWLTTGKSKFMGDPNGYVQGHLGMSWAVSYSAKDWESISPTRTERHIKTKLQDLQRTSEMNMRGTKAGICDVAWSMVETTQCLHTDDYDLHGYTADSIREALGNEYIIVAPEGKSLLHWVIDHDDTVLMFPLCIFSGKMRWEITGEYKFTMTRAVYNELLAFGGVYAAMTGEMRLPVDDNILRLVRAALEGGKVALLSAEGSDAIIECPISYSIDDTYGFGLIIGDEARLDAIYSNNWLVSSRLLYIVDADSLSGEARVSTAESEQPTDTAEEATEEADEPTVLLEHIEVGNVIVLDGDRYEVAEVRVPNGITTTDGTYITRRTLEQEARYAK